MKKIIYEGPRPLREIRAVYNENSIRVYQAFSAAIAIPAIENQTFVSPFKFELSWASWIKPSFLWTLTRTQWGKFTRIGKKQEKGEHEDDTFVLGVDVKRDFFDKILSIGQLTHYPEGFDKIEWKKLMQKAKVYVQWDPEKSINGRGRSWKAIQIGLKTKVLKEYAESIVRIEDMSNLIETIKHEKYTDDKIKLLPNEIPYPVPEEIEKHIKMYQKN